MQPPAAMNPQFGVQQQQKQMQVRKRGEEKRRKEGEKEDSGHVCYLIG